MKNLFNNYKNFNLEVYNVCKGLAKKLKIETDQLVSFSEHHKNFKPVLNELLGKVKSVEPSIPLDSAFAPSNKYLEWLTNQPQQVTDKLSTKLVEQAADSRVLMIEDFNTLFSSPFSAEIRQAFILRCEKKYSTMLEGNPKAAETIEKLNEIVNSETLETVSLFYRNPRNWGTINEYFQVDGDSYRMSGLGNPNYLEVVEKLTNFFKTNLSSDEFSNLLEFVKRYESISLIAVEPSVIVPVLGATLFFSVALTLHMTGVWSEVMTDVDKKIKVEQLQQQERQTAFKQNRRETLPLNSKDFGINNFSSFFLRGSSSPYSFFNLLAKENLKKVLYYSAGISFFGVALYSSVNNNWWGKNLLKPIESTKQTRFQDLVKGFSTTKGFEGKLGQAVQTTRLFLTSLAYESSKTLASVYQGFIAGAFSERSEVAKSVDKLFDKIINNNRSNKK